MFAVSSRPFNISIKGNRENIPWKKTIVLPSAKSLQKSAFATQRFRQSARDIANCRRRQIGFHPRPSWRSLCVTNSLFFASRVAGIFSDIPALFRGCLRTGQFCRAAWRTSSLRRTSPLCHYGGIDGGIPQLLRSNWNAPTSARSPKCAVIYPRDGPFGNCLFPFRSGRSFGQNSDQFGHVDDHH